MLNYVTIDEGFVRPDSTNDDDVSFLTLELFNRTNFEGAQVICFDEFTNLVHLFAIRSDNSNLLGINASVE